MENWIEINEPQVEYNSKPLILEEETRQIIGSCFNVYNELGKGFLEIVYKDALVIEFGLKNIAYEREKKFEINYKGIKLPHFYYADFVISGNVILEVKAQNGVVDDHYRQVINYLAVSKCKVGLIVNFGEKSLRYKRIVL